jgi:hypothetical protein
VLAVFRARDTVAVDTLTALADRDPAPAEREGAA